MAELALGNILVAAVSNYYGFVRIGRTPLSARNPGVARLREVG
jgi:hypothetical protein